MTEDKTKDTSMALVQRQLMIEQAKLEQEFAKIDRLMKGRQVAFALATEAMKGASIDDIIKEAKKVEEYLSEGAREYLKLADALNENDAKQDELILKN